MECPKPVKGKHRKDRKAEHDSKMETFRIEVMALDREFECCNKLRRRWTSAFPPGDRTHWEVAHLIGKGRKPAWKYETFNGMRLCWWCHDLLDGRHNKIWRKLSADERKIKVLRWWEKNNPEHFEKRGWALPLEALENSVARRKVGE